MSDQDRVQKVVDAARRKDVGAVQKLLADRATLELCSTQVRDGYPTVFRALVELEDPAPIRGLIAAGFAKRFHDESNRTGKY